MTFQTSNLVGDRVLVHGTDTFGTAGKTIVDATQWLELKARKDMSTATADFDAAVEAFYAPLTEAADKASAAMKGNRPEDSSAYVVLVEATEGVPANAGVTVPLTRDSVILRLIEEQNTDRLVWVDDSLEVLEVLPNTHTASATQVDAHGEASPEQDETDPNR